MSLFFKNRDGHTPLDPSMLQDLKQTHVQDMTELYELESENIAEGILWSQQTTKHHLDYLTWLELHKHMLSNVWSFAGKPRKNELMNSDFHKPYAVMPALLELQRDVIYWIEHKAFPELEIAARFHLQLLTIHPFKDGNGRWARVLTEFICRREKIEIPNWGFHIANDEVRRNTYIAAVKKARHQGEFLDLINIMYFK